MELFHKNGLVVAKKTTWQDTTKLEATIGAWQVLKLKLDNLEILLKTYDNDF